MTIDMPDIPDFLRRKGPVTPEYKERLARIAAQDRGSQRQWVDTFKAPKVSDEEAAILKEADLRWRHWRPSRENGLRRPQRRTFIARVRREFKAAEREKRKAERRKS